MLFVSFFCNLSTETYLLRNVSELHNLFSLLKMHDEFFFSPHPLSRMSSPVPSIQDQHTPSGAYILPNFPAQGCQLFYTLLKSCEILSKEARSRKGEKRGSCSNIRGWGLCNREDHFYFCRNDHCRAVVFRMWSENLLSPHDPPFSNYMSV